MTETHNVKACRPASLFAPARPFSEERVSGLSWIVQCLSFLWLLALLPSVSAQYASVKVGKIEIKHVGPQLVSDELIRSNIRVKPGNEYPSPLALQAALDDSSEIVRQAARRSLQEEDLRS